MRILFSGRRDGRGDGGTACTNSLRYGAAIALGMTAAYILLTVSLTIKLRSKTTSEFMVAALEFGDSNKVFAKRQYCSRFRLR